VTKTVRWKKGMSLKKRGRNVPPFSGTEAQGRVCVCVCDGSAEILLQICLIKPLSGDTHLELKEREREFGEFCVDLRRTHTYI